MPAIKKIEWGGKIKFLGTPKREGTVDGLGARKGLNEGKLYSPEEKQKKRRKEKKEI